MKENFIRRCIDLASKGEREVSPNPMVGCVITRGNEIISEGYHEYFGGPHAEVNALSSLGDPTGCTLYVSLEPCSHFGKTPPCVDRIISSGIKDVVIGARDPKNSGGATKLAQHGINVTCGVLEEEVKAQNFRFFTSAKKQKPYVILKWAESADGFIGKKGERVPISSEHSNIEVHKWRAKEAGILVGSETVLNDNPRLDVRYIKGRNPTRIVIDRRNRILGKKQLDIFKPTAPVILFGYEEAVVDGYIYTFPETEIEKILQRTVNFGIDSVIVEGGSEILRAFLPFYDELRVIRSPKKLLSGVESPRVKELPDDTPSNSDMIFVLKRKDFTSAPSYLAETA